MGVGWVFILCLFGVCFGNSCQSSHSYLTSSMSGTLGCSSYVERVVESWSIQVPISRIVLEFSSFNISIDDTITIYDGSSTTSPVLGSYSGSVIPGPFLSSTEDILVYFISNSNSKENYGFEATWSTILVSTSIYCNSNFQLLVGSDIGSFGCNGYTNQLSSSWQITGTQSERLVLTFDEFDTEDTYDVVSVYDGPDASSPLLGAYSGTTLPQSIIGSSNELFVTFVTNYSYSRKGFTASWSSISGFSDTCYANTNHIMLYSSGYIGCPYGYGNNVKSSWLIQPKGDFLINFQFLRLNTEVDQDLVYIYDGATEEDPLLGIFSGFELPKPVQSSGNQMLVVFMSNEELSARGFTGYFELIHAIQSTVCSQSGKLVLTSPKDSLGCDGVSHDTFHSWTLKSASVIESVSLSWEQFNTGSDRNVIYVYDGNSNSSALIYKASSSNLPLPVISTSNWMYVEFVVVDDSDSAILNGIYQTINPSVPYSCVSSNSYSVVNNSGIIGCLDAQGSINQWIIQVQTGFTISLAFNFLLTQSPTDSVSVYDGPDSNSLLLGTWVMEKETSYPIISSSSNYMFIEFKTNSENLTSSSFVASYSSVFTGAVINSCYVNSTNSETDTEGIIGCTGYGRNIRTAWYIPVDEGSLIDIDFVFLDTQEQYDTLTIFNANNPNGEVLAQYSGRFLPSPLRVNSTSLVIQFDSDSAIEYGGFRLQYHITNPYSVGKCVDSQILGYGEFHSPIGCVGYASGINTTWNINVETAERIVFNFVLLDTVSPNDIVTIYDGNASRGKVIGTFSGDNVPTDAMSSTGNSLSVNFQTQSSSSTGGCVIAYRAYGSFLMPCETSTLTNSIYSHSGEFGCGAYSNNITVSWVISSFGNVFLNFEQFQLSVNDVVLVYDGTNSSGHLLCSYTGTYAPPVHSTSNSVYIEFQSGNSSNPKGKFKISFFTLALPNF